VGEPERGYDGDKRLARRKHDPLLDTGALVLGARVARLIGWSSAQPLGSCTAISFAAS
jgi:hypothetical protein